ncbi:NAD(P)/FAD-dependent oxidoreductase [Silvimonas iriomotensis]|uniref:Rubredoxin-NAD(+) reductase n=1 Tax=Silvimonas iriomotensis TaxID=449662 RepID=A0ABQ2P6W6_9NEIS|nr:FAD-dependent oxidoreductase [Silvimonas iriomotensis]GGP19532.1 Rubredoxin-NAD(+) reductase [Silvimonas iriomotensis]
MALPVVIVGAGLAGYNLAREFRKLDAEAELVIIAGDGADFYSKPMLSNALAGNKTVATLVMKPAEKMEAELNATIFARTEVVGIDREKQMLMLSDGQVQAYRDLVLAVGAEPVRLRLGGEAADEVLSVNHIDDFAHFSSKLEGVKRVVILGGGLIGCEFANDLLARGIEPVVVESAATPLPRLLPPQSGEWFAARLQAAGVRFVFGALAGAVHHAGSGFEVELSSGERLQADLVLSAVGLHPNNTLAEAAGLRVERGTVINRQLQTSDAHIYALGDCAEVEGLFLPFVMPIMHAARTLAQVLAGNTASLTYPAMPVLVKTPACPTVVSSPAAGAQGEWQVNVSEEGVDARFVNAQGQLLGFALCGAATKERQALLPQLPPVLA